MKFKNTINAAEPIRAVYFDMDGTIANLEGVKDWIPRLRACDDTPYREAEPLVDMERFDRLLEALTEQGIRVGIVSWGSMDAPGYYDRAVRRAKWDWCKRHFDVSKLSEFHVVHYGTDKHSVVLEKHSILVDDNENVRREWTGCGTIPAGKDCDIFGMLKAAVAK